MRIAVVNRSRRRVGGIETYLNTIISELAQAGHEIAFWHEVDEPVEHEQIELPPAAASWCVAALGARRALEALRDWRPSVIYTHQLLDPELERRVLDLAPSVFFAHDYQGTCISGDKTFKAPTVRPCSRSFGWQCLLHYYPHRCGGLNPVTMFKLYGLRTRRLENLRRYDAIVTHSDHMLSELIKHGLSPQRAYNFPSFIHPANAHDELSEHMPGLGSTGSSLAEAPEESRLMDGRSERSGWHLLFCGRMEHLKGGHVFIDALPEVASVLGKPLRVTFAGDGRARAGWEQQARRLQNSNLAFDFTGWVEGRRMMALFEACDLLVVPSLWPEPFGLVGPEAGAFGVPVAAFDVGGIHDWLLNGVNGYLASGRPPTAAGLARAIIECLQSPLTYARLRRGAVEVAQRFSMQNHLTVLNGIFASVVSQE
jgi:glycosyltransferase involved in cell wall biosynthesis